MTRPRKSDDLLVAALAHGKTHADAARIAGVSERTIRRRLEDPNFVARVERERAEVTAATAAQLAGLYAEALTALSEVLEYGEGHVRIRAAQIVLRTGLEFRERTEIDQRLRTLEERM